MTRYNTIEHVSPTSDTFTRRAPVVKSVTTAYVGAVVLWDDEEGQIVDMTDRHAIVEFEDGRERGIEWADIVLVNVNPDAAFLARKADAGQSVPRHGRMSGMKRTA